MEKFASSPRSLREARWNDENVDITLVTTDNCGTKFLRDPLLVKEMSLINRIKRRIRVFLEKRSKLR